MFEIRLMSNNINQTKIFKLIEQLITTFCILKQQKQKFKYKIKFLKVSNKSNMMT